MHRYRSATLAFGLIVALAATGERPHGAASDVWTAAAPMPLGRYSHTSSLLLDGRVLVAGGYDGVVATSTVQIFDPSTNTWVVESPMNVARASHVSAVLADGRVLVAGGYDALGNALPDAEVFTPATNTWSLVQSMQYPRYASAAALLLDGRVLVTGGYTPNANPYDEYTPTAEIFDPTTNTWQLVAPMAIHRVLHTATVLLDGRVLVAGGANYAQYENSAEIYDPATNAWTFAQPMSTQRYGQVASLLTDGRVLVAGGAFLSYQPSVEIYDPATNQWSPAAPMSTPRGNFTATRLTDGTVLVAGSWLGSSALNSAEVFDPTNNAWSLPTQMHAARGFAAATLLPDGHVLVTGGYDGTNPVTATDLWGPALTIVQVSSASGVFGGTTTLTATLTAAGIPLAAQTVQFALNGTAVGTAVTDVNGVTTLPGVNLAGFSVGSYPGAIRVTFSGVAPYSAGTGLGDLAVTQATPVVTWVGPADIPYGTALGAAQLDATANVAGTFVYTPGAGSVLSVGTHPVQVTFTPTDFVDYTTASASVPVTVIDVTPPVITPVVSGTLGTNGWYTSNVTVTWLVTDPESAVTAMTGCGLTTVSTDTAGLPLVCTATSSGGTAANSVTVKRDATPPVITIDQPAAGGLYGLAQSVGVGYACPDATAGVSSCTGPVPSGAALDTSTPGNQTFAVTATDLAGNSTGQTVTYTVLATATVAPTLAYIPNYLSANVSVIDTTTNRVVATIPVGQHPSGAVFNRAGTTVYVSNGASNTVSVIDVATNTVTGTIAVGQTPIGLAVGAGDAVLYVANRDSASVSVVNTASAQVTATISLAGSPFGLSISPAGSHVYVADTTANVVEVIDTTTNTIVASIPVGNSPLAAVVTPDGTHVYTTNSNAGSLSVIDTASNTVTAQIPSPNNTNIAFSADGTRGYITSSLPSSVVSVLDPTTNTLSAGTPLSNYPVGIGVAANGPRLYIGSAGSTLVNVIDTTSNAILTEVVVGNGPQFPALTPLPSTLVTQPATGRFGSTVGVSATLTVGGSPVTGRSVAFALNGIAVGSATTDVNGVATLAGATLVGIPGGTYAAGVTATFAGDGFYTSTTGTANLTVTMAAPAVMWAPPAPIAYGTPLGAAQLNATASVPGSFAYTPPAGTILNGGTGQVLSVVFTPADLVDFTSAGATTTIDVTPAAATLTVQAASGTTGGTASLAAVLRASSTGVAISGETVTFAINGSGVGSAVTNAAGVATFPAAIGGLVAGSYSGAVTAQSGGDANYQPTTGAPATLLVAPAPDTFTWMQLTPSGPLPPARSGHKLVYDSARGKVVLFGGQAVDGTFLNDIWEFDTATTTWTNVTPTSGPMPTPRAQFGMAYDEARAKIVIYGGFISLQLSNVGVIGDTWEWDGALQTWTQIPADTIVSTGLFGAELAYDPTRHQVILFGGEPYWITPNNGSTYAWTGSNWQILTSAGPEGRLQHTMSTDTLRSRVVLYGGHTDDTWPTVQNFTDTWEWDGTAWTQMAASGAGPAAYNSATLAYDSARGVHVLFGGFPALTNATWEWDGVEWASRAAVASPSPRGATAMVYDRAQTTLVLFGGNHDSPGGDWFNAAVHGAPPAENLGDTWIGEAVVVTTPSLTVSGTGVYGGTATLTATLTANTAGLSGRSITFTLNGTAVGTATTDTNGVASLTAVALTGLNAGTAVGALQATFAAELRYRATSALGDLAIAPAKPGLGWATPNSIVYGTALGAAQLDATAAVPGAFVYSPAAGTVLTVGTYQISVTFTPTDQVNYVSMGQTTQIVVTPATPILTWPSPANIVYGTALGAAQLDATANVPGTFVYTPAAGTALHAGAGQTPSVTFTPTDGLDYTVAAATVVITVSKAPLTIDADDQTQAYGGPIPALTGTLTGFVLGDTAAVLGGAPTYTTTALPGSPAGNYPITPLLAAQASTDYRFVFVKGTLTITKAVQTIAFGPLGNMTFGDPNFAVVATASSGLAVTFTAAGACRMNAGLVQLIGGGTCTITAHQAGDNDYVAAADVIQAFTVAPATPVVTWANPTPIVYGVPLGATQLNAKASVAGTFAYSPSAGTVLGVGPNQLTATFTPTATANYVTVTSTATIDVLQASTKVVVSALPNPSVVGQTVTLAATVTPVAPGAGVPKGFVQFTDNGTQLGAPVPLAMLPIPVALAVGAHTITVAYLGDANFLSSSSAGLAHTVNRAATAFTPVGAPVGLSANPSVYGQPVTVTTIFSVSTPGAGTPTGSIAFLDGGTQIGSVALPNPLVGPTPFSFMTSALAVGTHNIKAQYVGDSNFLPITAVVSDTVNKAGTMTALTVAPNPASSGQTIVLTAVVSPVGPGAGAPAGTVQFFGAPVGSPQVLLGSAPFGGTSGIQTPVVTITIPPSFSGSLNYSATYYLGNANFLTSTSATVPEMVQGKTATITTLTSSANPSVLQQPVQLTATVNAPSATGLVTFFDALAPLGTASVASGAARCPSASGTAFCALPGTPFASGDHLLSASYAGDNAHSGSTSVPITQTVFTGATPAPTITTLAVTGTLNHTTPLTFTATVTGGSAAPTGSVQFLVDGLVVGKVQIPPNSNTATLPPEMLTVSTHTIVAAYLGDPTHAGSVASTTVTVH